MKSSLEQTTINITFRTTATTPGIVVSVETLSIPPMKILSKDYENNFMMEL
jgi:hypothetical protein